MKNKNQNGQLQIGKDISVGQGFKNNPVDCFSLALGCRVGEHPIKTKILLPGVNLNSLKKNIIIDLKSNLFKDMLKTNFAGITLLLVLMVSSATYSQTLEENKVDEFTGNSVKRTSWEILNQTMKFNAFSRISRINENTYLDLKIMIGGKVFAIAEGDELMLKLSNDEIIKLQSIKYEITCTGCGARGYSGSQAQGLSVIYSIANDQIEKLKNNSIIRVRIYTTNGYVEEDTKPKNADIIMNALKLTDN